MSKLFYFPLYILCGIYLKFSTKKIPSPPFPESGLHMNVKVGLSFMYASSASASSGS